MGFEYSPNNLIKLLGFWKKKWFPLIILLILTIVLKHYGFPFSDWLSCICLIVLLIILVSIWGFSTNRIQFSKNSTINISIIASIDDNVIEGTVTKLLEDVIEHIKNENDLRHIRIRLLPLNEVKNVEKAQKLLNSSRFSSDAVIFIRFISGNVQSAKSFKLQIQKLSFISSINLKSEKKLLTEKIIAENDFTLRSIGNNYEYLEQNSFNDKIKIVDNLKDLIIFYSGIHLLYYNKFSLALLNLRILFKKEETILKKYDKLSADKFRSKINSKQLKAGRLYIILIDLYMICAQMKYNEGELEQMFKIYEEADRKLGVNNQSFKIYVPLAKYYYEKGDLPKSKEYTKKMQALHPNSPLVYLNYAFYSVLEKNLTLTVRNYRKLLESDLEGKSTNYVEVYDFIIEEKKKYPDNDLFIISELVIQKMSGIDLDPKLLQTLKEFENKESLNKLIKLLTGETRHNRKATRVKKSKRKRKRR